LGLGFGGLRRLPPGDADADHRRDGNVELEPLVRNWIETVALPGCRVNGVRPLIGGYSNDNSLVMVSGGPEHRHECAGEYVLRRYLRTNSCAVESALAKRLTGVVAVAEVIAADPTGEAAGEPLLLSTFMPGRLLSEVLVGKPGSGTATAGGTTSADGGAASELGHAVGRTLAAIGSIEFDSPGFFSDGSLEPGPHGLEPTSDVDAFVRRCLAEGNATGHLSDDEQRKLIHLAEQAASDLEVLRGARRLVHSDFNPKNLLVAETDGAWQVTAVLDWEFAFSSSPLFDIGNMLRDPRPAGFAEAFVHGFQQAGGALPPDWRQLSRALDLYALADFLTRPVDHRYFQRAVKRIRDLVAG
jgi:aminoglycoside phosphotransferase (APT) family kinase protein